MDVVLQCMLTTPAALMKIPAAMLSTGTTFPATVIGPPPNVFVKTARVTGAVSPTVHLPSPVTPAAVTPILGARVASPQVAPLGSFCAQA
jgi:hypothetical protein